MTPAVYRMGCVRELALARSCSVAKENLPVLVLVWVLAWEPALALVLLCACATVSSPVCGRKGGRGGGG